MKRIKVSASKNYDVIIERGCIEKIGEMLKEIFSTPRKIFIVTDESVNRLYLKTVEKSLVKSGYSTFSVVIGAGEGSKSIGNFAMLSSRAVKCRMTRDDVFVALGGGVIGDLVGFVSASFMRGTAFVQIPTTLLSAIDSSVGGKTAINLEEGKNLIGAFHQPSAVFLDINTLKTLPDEEMLCGLGEAIKYAVLSNGEIFEILNDGFTDDNLERLIELCVSYKAEIVRADERERGVRKLLNLGHTIGHAIEKLSNFSIKHGLAVIKGLLAICVMQNKRGILCESQLDKIVALVDKYGFNKTLDYQLPDIIRVITTDKKVNRDASISLALVKNVGECYIENIKINELLGLFNED